MKYRFMNEHRHEYSLALMCRVLQVARAGFYAWLKCPLSERAKDDARLLELIRHSYAASHGGRPSIIEPNHLQREFTVDGPNKVWVTDITYIRTW